MSHEVLLRFSRKECPAGKVTNERFEELSSDLRNTCETAAIYQDWLVKNGLPFTSSKRFHTKFKDRKKYYKNAWLFTDLVVSAKLVIFSLTSSSTAFVSCLLCPGNHAPQTISLHNNSKLISASLALPVFAKMLSDVQMLRPATLETLTPMPNHSSAPT